jgi:hypothetical protein
VKVQILLWIWAIACLVSLWPIFNRHWTSPIDRSQARYEKECLVYGRWALWSWLGLSLVALVLPCSRVGTIVYNLLALCVVLMANSRRED